MIHQPVLKDPREKIVTDQRQMPPPLRPVERCVSKAPVPSGSCEEIGRRIKVATVVEMVQPLDCECEPITGSSTPGIDRSFPTDSAHR
jgi:hypothetical protein